MRIIHQLLLASWESGSTKRVGRSTLAAEADASCEAMESGVYLQMLLDDLWLGENVTMKQLEERSRRIRKVHVISDSNSVCDATLLDPGGGVQDKRLRIVIAMLREAMSPSSEKKCASFTWCNTHKMVADALAKIIIGCPALIALMVARPFNPPPGKLGRAIMTARQAAGAGMGCASTPCRPQSARFVLPAPPVPRASSWQCSMIPKRRRSWR